MEMKSFNIFCHLEEEFIQEVKLFHVFQTFSENEFKSAAFLVSQDDSVYSIGSNKYGCLGLGHENDCSNPTKVEFLCNKKLKEFACGAGHALGLTEDGRLYGWGNNKYGKVGVGSEAMNVTSPALVEALRNEEIVKISAGECHSLALSENGKLFGWGWSKFGQVGVGSNARLITSPTEVAVGSEKVVDVECGGEFSLALTDAGQIYSWGGNDFGQLSTGLGPDRLTPSKLQGCLAGVRIKQITCGYSHALALTVDGDVYAWGWNVWGSVGNGSTERQPTPLKLDVFGQVEKIACYCLLHTSTAMTRDGAVFLWGRFNDEFDSAVKVLTPRRTDAASLTEAFAKWAYRPVTPKTVVVVAAALPTVEELTTLGAASVASSFAVALDDEESSDVTFLVEGRKIFAHKLILRFRSEYFRKMLFGSWKEGQNREIEITDYSYSTFKGFIDFAYKGTLLTSPEVAANLMVLADCYCDQELKQLCSALLETAKIEVKNAAVFYDTARKFHMEELKEKSFRFMFKFLKKVRETTAFEALKEEVKTEFMDRAFWVGHKNIFAREEHIVWS